MPKRRRETSVPRAVRWRLIREGAPVRARSAGGYQTAVRAGRCIDESDHRVPFSRVRSIIRVMLWGERVTRRRVLIGIIVVFGLVDVAFAFASCTDDARSMSQAVRSIRSSERSSRTTRESRSASMRRFSAGSREHLLSGGPQTGFGGGRRRLRRCGQFNVSPGDSSLERPRSSGMAGASPARLLRARRSAGLATTTACSSARWSASSHTNRAPRRSCTVTLPRSARTMTPGPRISVHGLGHGLMISTGLDLPFHSPSAGASTEDGIATPARGRVHGEPLGFLRRPLTLAPRRRSSLSMRRGRARGQAAVLPDGHVADSASGR